MELEHYKEIRDILEEHTGLRGSEDTYWQDALRFLRKHIKKRGFASVRAYTEHVKSHLEGELGHLQDFGLVHATNFFRDPEFWKELYREALCSTPVGAYKALSLGCSKGSELATIAALAYHRFGAGLEIRAYDISKRSVASAQNPAVHRTKLERLPESGMKKLFAGEASRRQRLIPEVRACLTVQVADARTVELPEAHFDLVLCRNLPFYFDTPTVEAFYQRCHKALKPTGYLGIGSVDPIPSKALFAPVGNMLYRHILPQR